MTKGPTNVTEKVVPIGRGYLLRAVKATKQLQLLMQGLSTPPCEVTPVRVRELLADDPGLAEEVIRLLALTKERQGDQS